MKSLLALFCTAALLPLGGCALRHDASADAAAGSSSESVTSTVAVAPAEGAGAANPHSARSPSAKTRLAEPVVARVAGGDIDLRNASASARVVPTEGELLIEQIKADSALLTSIVEEQLAQMEDLSGSYVGIIIVTGAGGEDAERVLDVLRLVPIEAGENQFEVFDDTGLFSVDMHLEETHGQRSAKGKISYHKHSEIGSMSVNTELALPEGIVMFGMGSSRTYLLQQAAAGAKGDAGKRGDTRLSGIFVYTVPVES